MIFAPKLRISMLERKNTILSKRKACSTPVGVWGVFAFMYLSVCRYGGGGDISCILVFVDMGEVGIFQGTTNNHRCDSCFL